MENDNFEIKESILLAILPNLSILEFENKENAKTANPIAIILKTTANPYISYSGWMHKRYDFIFITEDDANFIQIGRWKVYNSFEATYYPDHYEYGWAGYKKDDEQPIDFIDRSDQGIMNEFMIQDSNGQIKRIYFKSIKQLFFNLDFYQNYSTWEELHLSIENEILKKVLKQKNIDYKPLSMK